MKITRSLTFENGQKCDIITKKDMVLINFFETYPLTSKTFTLSASEAGKLSSYINDAAIESRERVYNQAGNVVYFDDAG